jgi:hypothetical protein
LIQSSTDSFEGVKGAPQEEPVEAEVNLDESEIEELPDGSAIVRYEGKGPMEDEDFYQNLADDDNFSPLDLSMLALKYIELAEKDKQARSKRDEQYEDGIRRTGMGNDAPGGANFHRREQGCSPCYG